MSKSYTFANQMFAGVALVLAGALSIAHAKPLSLYAQPVLGAKVADTVDTASGMILIYTTKDGNWVKVANPKNGNVGWVPAKSLNQSGVIQSTFAYSAGPLEGGKTAGTYQVFRFGGEGAPDKAATDAMLKRVESQQLRVRQSMQHMMLEMDQLMKQQWHLFNEDIFPMAMPVVLVPVTVKQPQSQTKSVTEPASVKSEKKKPSV